MTFSLYLHIGYLIDYDARGFAFGFGDPKAWSPGAPRYAVWWSKPFPWWMQHEEVRRQIWIWQLRRKQARAEKR